MTIRQGNILRIERERKQQCDFCGKIDELRPYGPKGECICFDCGMKNRESTDRQFLSRLEGTHPYDRTTGENQR